MASRTWYAVLASLALLAAPLAAQDTTSAPKPAPDTTGARRDTVVVTPPAPQPAPAPTPVVVDTTAVRKDTTAAAPVADTTATAVPDNAVRPGMTEADVRARWGDPLAVRTVNDWTYLFYDNRRERRVGFEDVVFLQHGQVMDAIVRSPDHVYAGVSSSPEGRMPVFTPPRGQPADSTKGAAVTGVQVKPGQ